MKKNIEDIYVEYFDLVYKYLYCLTQNGDLAEELTQDTFFKAIMNINTFKNQSKISTWLCQIAKNLYFDELRKKKKISDTSDDIFDYINIDENGPVTNGSYHRIWCDKLDASNDSIIVRI